MTITIAQIRAARGLLGWNQKTFAENISMSTVHVSRIEAGNSKPPLSTLEKIQALFERKGLEFLELDGVQRSTMLRHTELYGQVGLQQFFDDVYNATKETRLEINILNGDPSALITHLTEEWYQDHSKRMASLNVPVKVLIKDGDENFIGGTFAEYRWMKKDAFEPETIYIYGNKVAYIDFQNEDPKILVIERQGIAASQRRMFCDTWRHSAKVIK